MTPNKNSSSTEKPSSTVTIASRDKRTGKVLDYIVVPADALSSTNPSTSSTTPGSLYRHKVDDTPRQASGK